jgi:hypothetical protein
MIIVFHLIWASIKPSHERAAEYVTRGTGERFQPSHLKISVKGAWPRKNALDIHFIRVAQPQSFSLAKSPGGDALLCADVG